MSQPPPSYPPQQPQPGYAPQQPGYAPQQPGYPPQQGYAPQPQPVAYAPAPVAQQQTSNNVVVVSNQPAPAVHTTVVRKDGPNHILHFIICLFCPCLSRSDWKSLLRVAVPHTRKKTTSSTKWLHRQNKDPLVRKAVMEQYRCRSAYKLIELDNKFHFLTRGGIVVDCGARPGAWSQVTAERVGTSEMTSEELVTWKGGMVLAVDIEELMDLPGVIVMNKCDVTKPDAHHYISKYLSDRKADVILSDMSPNASGIQEMDHQRIIQLAQSAFQLSQTILREGGVFVCKLWQGSLTNNFKSELKKNFKRVKECRLKSTRKESSEIFIYANHFSLPSNPDEFYH